MLTKWYRVIHSYIRSEKYACALRFLSCYNASDFVGFKVYEE